MAKQIFLQTGRPCDFSHNSFAVADSISSGIYSMVIKQASFHCIKINFDK